MHKPQPMVLLHNYTTAALLTHYTPATGYGSAASLVAGKTTTTTTATAPSLLWARYPNHRSKDLQGGAAPSSIYRLTGLVRYRGSN